MAFSQVKLGETVFGDKRVTFGSYNGAGVTTGDLNTGLLRAEVVMLTAAGALIVADAPTVNKTFPCAGPTVPIIFTSGSIGYWMAYGA